MCHFLDLICSVPKVSITIGVSYSNKSRLKKFHFLDLVCSVNVAVIKTWLSYSKKEWPQKVAFYGPSMFSTFSSHYN